jgi:hypothetical protein
MYWVVGIPPEYAPKINALLLKGLDTVPLTTVGTSVEPKCSKSTFAIAYPADAYVPLHVKNDVILKLPPPVKEEVPTVLPVKKSPRVVLVRH